jgi:hypothetical protein
MPCLPSRTYSLCKSSLFSYVSGCGFPCREYFTSPLWCISFLMLVSF